MKAYLLKDFYIFKNSLKASIMAILIGCLIIYVSLNQMPNVFSLGLNFLFIFIVMQCLNNWEIDRNSNFKNLVKTFPAQYKAYVDGKFIFTFILILISAIILFVLFLIFKFENFDLLLVNICLEMVFLSLINTFQILDLNQNMIVIFPMIYFALIFFPYILKKLSNFSIYLDPFKLCLIFLISCLISLLLMFFARRIKKWQDYF